MGRKPLSSLTFESASWSSTISRSRSCLDRLAAGDVPVAPARAEVVPLLVENRLTDVGDPFLRAVPADDPELDLLLRLLLTRHILAVFPEALPVLGVDDAVDQVGVALEIRGGIPGQLLAGGRDVDEAPLRVHPVLPVVGVVGDNAELLLGSSKRLGRALALLDVEEALDEHLLPLALDLPDALQDGYLPPRAAQEQALRDVERRRRDRSPDRRRSPPCRRTRGSRGRAPPPGAGRSSPARTGWRRRWCASRGR